MSSPATRLTIDEASFVPLPEQIRRGVRELIAAGALSVGDRMVTVRQLAGDLRLSPGTVAKGYQLLEADGVVQTRGRKGTFISAVPARDSLPDSVIRDAAARYLAVAREHGLSVAEAAAVLTEVYEERV